ncbi:hypothetical protein, partial [Alkalibacterium sp. s-m-28]
SDFLQIPPHGGHPCHSLTVPTAKPVVDFHHQVVAHAGRTKKNGTWLCHDRKWLMNLLIVYSEKALKTTFSSINNLELIPIIHI